MFSWKNALRKIKIYTILTEYFGIDLTLHLLDELIDGISKDKVTFEGRMRM